MALLLVAPGAFALDPGRSMSQYVRDRWSVEQGFPRGPVYALAQTADGYLWMGTERGLVRFDGLRFEVVEALMGKRGPLTHVLGLVADRDGGLWVRPRRPALAHYRDGELKDAVVSFGLPRGSVAALAGSSEGLPLVWMLRGEASAVLLEGGKYRTLAAPADFSRSPVLSLAQTRDGAIWVATRDAGLFRVKDGKTTAFRAELPDPKVNVLAARGDEVWIGTDGGLIRWDGAKLTKAGIPAPLAGVQILSMTVDRHGNLWAGTNAQGLLRLNALGVSWLDPGGSEGRDAITAVFEDREGNLWTGSASGLERIRDSAFVSYTKAEGMPADALGPVYAGVQRTWFAPEHGGLWRLEKGKAVEVVDAGPRQDVVYSMAGAGDGLWVGRQRGGLTHLREEGGRFVARSYTANDGLAQNSVYAVEVGRDGAVWAGTLSGGVSRWERGKFTTFRVSDGLAANTVNAILEGGDGTMWFATPNGLSALRGKAWHTYRRSDGLPADEVNCLFEDAGGRLWVGTAAGLALREGGRLRWVGTEQAVFREPVLGIAGDGVGALWMATANHVLRADGGKLAAGEVKEGDWREYGTADGLRGVGGVKRHRSVVADARGRIWFSLSRGLAVVHPALLGASAAPALVHVQSLAADGVALPVRGSVRIPGGSRRVVLGFAGLGLSMPERVRYRYKLEEFEGQWSEPVAAREAVYTNLGPGTYRFRVLASNADGMWNSQESGLTFAIAPLPWQTWWFRVGCAGLLAGAMAGAYRERLRRATRQLNVRFEERLAERTRIAQELHDTLLQGILSASMQLHVAADQVPEGSAAKPSLERVLGLMSRVIDEGRNAVRGLRTNDGDGLDLGHAFAGIPEELGLSGQGGFQVIVQGEPRRLHPLLRDEVYRIGREAVGNALRHAGASRIEVEIVYTAKGMRLVIRDDGRGIDPAVLEAGREGHWGLAGMRERAEKAGGQLHLRSSAGAGTEVEFRVAAAIAFESATQNGWFRRLQRRRGQAAEGSR